MTDEQIKIIIAEACGWRKNLSESDPRGSWFTPQGDSFAYGDQLPDYLNDLNAMHEAEGILTNEQIEVYCSLLQKPQWGIWWAISATARQRAEAFLKTKGIIP